MNRRNLLTTLGSTSFTVPLLSQPVDLTYHYLNRLFSGYYTQKVHPDNKPPAYVSYLIDTDQSLLLQYRYHPTPTTIEFKRKTEAYSRIVDIDSVEPTQQSIFVANPQSHSHGHQILEDIRKQGIEYAEKTHQTLSYIHD